MRYDERREAVGATVNIIMSCLQPFLREEGFSKALLVDAVDAASRLGWVLFSQVYVTEFHWSTDGRSKEDCKNEGKKGTMEVFPELRKWLAKNEKGSWITLYRRVMG